MQQRLVVLLGLFIIVILTAGLLLWFSTTTQNKVSLPIATPIMTTSPQPAELGDTIEYLADPNPINTRGVHIRFSAAGHIEWYNIDYAAGEQSQAAVSKKEVGVAEFQKFTKRLTDINFFSLSTDNISCVPDSQDSRLSFTFGGLTNQLQLCNPAGGWPEGFPGEELMSIVRDLNRLAEN